MTDRNVLSGSFYYGMRKKILFIGTRPVLPMKDGRTVLINQYCSIFVSKLNCDVYYACFGLEGEQPEYFSKVYSLEEPDFIEQIFNVLWQSIILRNWPLQASLIYSRKTQHKLDELVNEIKPDIIICDMARMAPYMHRRYVGDCVKVLDMDDLLSKRYYRQAEQEKLDDNVLGQFRNKLPDFVVKLIVKLKLVRKFLYLEARLMEKYERKVVKEFYKTFFCSPIDAAEFNVHSERKADCIHVAVDVDYFCMDNTEENCCKNCIGYLGNIDVSANKDSVFYLAEHIMPKLLEKDPTFRLLVVGNCSQKTYKLFQKYSFIDFTFRVEDIRSYVKGCLAIVAPLQYGSGIKIKIIESMAMGIPVITNKYGTEGLDVVRGEELIECSEDMDYVKAIVQLNQDEILRRKIASNGRNYVMENHSMKKCEEELRGLINENDKESNNIL